MTALKRYVVWAVLALAVALVLRSTQVEDLVTTLPPANNVRVVVCGASYGIGRILAQQYARQGAKVVVLARSLNKLEVLRDQLAAEGYEHVYPVAADLSDAAQAKAVIEDANDVLGGRGIDHLVLNHVYGYWGNWGAVAPEDMAGLLQRVLSINAQSYILLASYALPYLKQSRGVISVVSSAAGVVPMPKTAPYSASKHALHGFFGSLRHELIHNNTGVDVAFTVLGSIDTEKAKENTKGEVEHLSVYPAEKAAEAVYRATFRRRRISYYPIHELLPLHLLHSLFPGPVEALVRSLVYTD